MPPKIDYANISTGRGRFYLVPKWLRAQVALMGLTNDQNGLLLESVNLKLCSVGVLFSMNETTLNYLICFRRARFVIEHEPFTNTLFFKIR